jgi:hypothetical protein
MAFVGIGVVLAAAGGASVFFNWGQKDQERRQFGWIVFAAGLALVAMTLFATRTPHH